MSIITNRLYGNYLSQPSRAILWAAAIKGLPLELKKINPVGGEAETPEFLAKFPSGFIPALEVVEKKADSGEEKPIVSLSEGGAILQYLAEVNSWQDLYPTGTDQDSTIKRAKIQQWMHWQHKNLRDIATVETFQKDMLIKMRKLGITTSLFDGIATSAAAANGVKSEDELTDSERSLIKSHREAHIQKKWKDAMLTMTYGAFKNSSGGSDKKGPFLASTNASDASPSIADLLLYCEIDQVHYGGLYDFNQWPEVREWMHRMEQLPAHDEVRRSLFKFMGKKE